MTPAARWALAAYPPSFRDRYGAELAALVEDVGPSRRSTVGLYLGAVRAWLRPAFTGADATRIRLQATVTTVWVAWCAGFLLAPAIDKALLDPPGAGVDATVRRLLDAAAAFLVAGWLVALVGVALLVARSLLPALREGRRTTLRLVLRPLVPALALGVLEAAGLAALAWVAADVLAVAWVVGLVALLAGGGLGPAVVVRRLRPATSDLRLPAVLAAALTLCLVGLTVSCASAVLLAGDAALVGSAVPVAAVTVIAAVAAGIAVVSSARGVLALRHPA